MKIYNTLSRKVEEIVPFKDNKIGFYACGPTVYDYVHIGHLRKYTIDDLFVRILKHDGFTVNHVQNITDVGHLVSDSDEGEDKMEKGARKYETSVWELAKRFEEFFWKSMETMGVNKPDVSCRATDHIAEQIALVQKLETKGYIYAIADGVYFDTSKFPRYAALAKLDLEQQKSEARKELISGKKHPSDFALWKFSPKDQKRQMEWDSPWGKGFPGWHIECSAMSMKYLGEQFEIHTGGIDHIPVHHTNEIAQSEAATGKSPFVKYWAHYNFLRVEGEKMSKSLNNFFTIEDIVKKEYEPMALKLLFYGAHYRSELNFTWKALDATQKSWYKLLEYYRSAKQEKERTVLSDEKLAKVDASREQFFKLLEDDLKTPEAMAVIWEVLKSNIPGSDKVDLIRSFDEVLGLHIDEHAATLAKNRSVLQEIPQEVQELEKQRQLMRQNKKFEEADAVRKQIEQLGWKAEDHPGKPSTFKRIVH